MPQLGCNISQPLLDLLRAGRDDVDWIKVSRLSVLDDELALARPLRPVLLHVLPHVGVRSLDDLPLNWDDLNRLIRAAGSPHVAAHLEVHADDFDGNPTEREIVERMVATTAALVERLAVPPLVENPPYHGPGWKIPGCCVDPAVVREVCDRTGVGLLLDVVHARVSASHRGEDVYSYLKAMPLDRVGELHVCGPGVGAGGKLWDSHLEMQQADYDLLDWTLGVASPAIVTLEYAGTGPLFEWRSDPTALERQLSRLARICA